METIPTLDTSDALAKRFPTAASLRAHIEAEIAAARMPWAQEPVRFEPGDEELVEPAPVPQRRQRKRALASTLRVARRAGADRVIVDGVVIVLSPSAAVPETDANEWDAVLSEVDHGPN